MHYSASCDVNFDVKFDVNFSANACEGIAIMEKKEPLRDWTSKEVLEAFKRLGLTVADLVAEWNATSPDLKVTVGSLYRALSHPSYPGYELLIAGVLGMKVEDVWPLRVAARRQKEQARDRALLEVRALAARQVA